MSFSGAGFLTWAELSYTSVVSSLIAQSVERRTVNPNYSDLSAAYAFSPRAGHSPSSYGTDFVLGGYTFHTIYVGEDAFRACTDFMSAKEVFAKSVKRVEVETHSYCNRRCNYCPNVVGDRLGENKRMKPEHWAMILRDLASIDFSSNLVFTSYDEPLADRDILDRIREASQAIPKARLMVYTNGDYLNKVYLQELAGAGLHYLHVSIHTRFYGRFSEVDALNLMSKLVRRVSRPIQFKRLVPNEFIVAEISHPIIEIEVRAINFQKHGVDRAGLVTLERQVPKRTASCHLVFAHFSVGFSGNVTPCCHVRSDSPENSEYLYGNLDQFDSIFQAWGSQEGAAWRRELITDLPKREPCATCSVGLFDGRADTFQKVRATWLRHDRDGVIPESAS